MPRVTYVEHNGREHTIELETGTSVMQGAIENMIPGIDGDCGGECACATCHVVVDPAWSSRLPPVSDEEEAMLDTVFDLSPTSRLSCQLRLSEALDGLRARLP